MKPEGQGLSTDFYSALRQRGGELNAIVEIFEPAIIKDDTSQESVGNSSTPGALSETPIAVKDMIAIKGHRRGNGNLHDMLEAPFETEHANVIDHVLAAGGQIVATTSLLEYAAGAQHPEIPETRNPLDERLTAGGSSAGSAALVGAGVIPLSVGTDTGGSIRIPAAYCGVVGFKPSSGAISLAGVTPLAPTYDHVGYIAGNIDLIDRAMQASSDGYISELSEPTHSSTKVRIGIPRALIDDQRNDLRIVQRFREIETRLSEEGYELTDVDTALLEELRSAFIDVVLFEAWQIYGSKVENDPTHFGAPTLRLFMLSSEVTEEQYQIALERRASALDQLSNYLRDIEILMMPTVPYFAPESTPPIDSELGSYEGLYTEIFNVSGQPAITLPAACQPMVMGIQLVGPLNSDARLLRIASSIAPLLL